MRLGGTSEHKRNARAFIVLTILALTSMIVPRGADANPSRDGWGFGIADDAPASVLDGQGFRQLGTKIFRFQVPYDAIDDQDRLNQAEQKIDAARAAGVQNVMLTLGLSIHDDPRNPTTRPEPSYWYGKMWYVVDRLAAKVDLWGVANEPNHKWLAGDDGACKVAHYYQLLSGLLASRGLQKRLVSPEWHDEVDDNGQPTQAPGKPWSKLRDYIQHYQDCGGGFGAFLGWHPYGGIAHVSTASTLDLLAIVPTVPVLISEVGSVVAKPGPIYLLDESAQAGQVRWLVDTLANVSSRIARVYYYDERQPSEADADDHPDSGLERRDTVPRPAWYEYCSAIYSGRVCEPPVPPVVPDGTFVKTLDGTVYRIAGGTPVHLFTCASQGYYPGCSGSTIYNVPFHYVAEWAARQPFPRDGTFLWHPNGTVYRVAGGALVYLSTCAAFGYFPGCSNLIALDGLAMDGLVNAQALPRNGTLVRAPSGAVFRMECGDAAYVSDCAVVGGCGGLVDLDGLAIERLVAPPGCDDGKPCTTDRCEGTLTCRHGFAAQCLAPVLQLLNDSDCGDGTTDAGEACDDGNATSGDGCSGTCRVESCFACAGRPSTCTPIAACVDGDGCCAPGCSDEDTDCQAGSLPIVGTKLRLSDRDILFTAKDGNISGIGINPVAEGAHLQVYNPTTGESACVSLPNANGAWRAIGTGANVSYLYKDSRYANGPCKLARIKRGLLTATCRANVQPIPYTLGEPNQGSVGVNFITGDRTFCAFFGGTITRDIGTSVSSNGNFAAVKAPAPATCPVAPTTCP